MSIVVFYPTKDYGAPSLVAQNLVKTLIKKADNINTELKIFSAKKQNFNDISSLSFRDINSLLGSDIFHIPTSPQITLNPKLLLYIIGFTKKKTILHNLHNDAFLEIFHDFNVGLIPHYLLYRRFLNRISKVITNSFLLKDYLAPRYMLDNITVIPNGIEEWWFKDDSEDFEVLGEPAIFHHSRLWADKGIYQLLIAFSKVVKDNPKCVLHIAGEGPLDSFFIDLVRSLKIEENVKFLGQLDRREVKKYLVNSDASIYPSINDNFPLSVLEAFSASNGPVYYSEAAGIDDFVKMDGFNLNSFYPSVGNIKERIHDIIDGNFSKNISKDQKQFSRKYNLDFVADEYIRLYNSIIE